MLRSRCSIVASIASILVLGGLERAVARDMVAPLADTVQYVLVRHHAGRLAASVLNEGRICYTPPDPETIVDRVTGESILNGSEYPIASGRRYIVPAGIGIWIGGIGNKDTLVTTTRDFEPAYEIRPIPMNGRYFHCCAAGDSAACSCPEAVSDEDFSVTFADTAYSDRLEFYDYLDHRPHEPLRIEVTQESYAWGLAHADDIVFFSLKIRSFADQVTSGVYVGLMVEPQVAYAPTFRWGAPEDDDVVGYLQTFPAPFGCRHLDTVNIAWAADNDGDPLKGAWIDRPVPYPDLADFSTSTRGIIGLRFLGSFGQSKVLSFNWFTGTYGPMSRSKFRDYRTGYSGAPSGDRNHYFVLSNGEIDFPSPYTAVIPNSGIWLMPQPAQAQDIADGNHLVFTTAIGPFTISPGATAVVDFCLLAAENFHVDPNNGANLPLQPQTWFNNVDFSGLARNAVWAQRIYDNPGVDTDGDGYAGEYRVCVLDSALVEGQWVPMVADTEWYKGDGVPDWRASTPPVAPYVWVEPIKNGLHIRINGEVSETAKDVLTETVDFEGYRVYLGRDERRESFSLVASYDKDNYDKWVFDSVTAEWSVREDPFTLEQLRCLYGSGSDPCTDSSFIPVAYFDRSHYFQMAVYPDSVFYFTPHDRNSSAFGLNTPITKTYPDMPDPRTLSPEQLTPEMYTEDGHFKFYEYQLDLTDLLPTVGYFVSVTTFDFGSPASGVAPLETEITEQPVEAFPLHELDQPLSGSDEIYIYPNPYRLDVDYRELGLEGRNQDDRWDERVRTVWFANLPPKCTIHIFTLDGDRVRTIEHNVPVTDPTYRRHAWDLINRNYQTVKTGLYYWVVEIPGGKSQVGKLALIR